MVNFPNPRRHHVLEELRSQSRRPHERRLHPAPLRGVFVVDRRHQDPPNSLDLAPTQRAARLATLDRRAERGHERAAATAGTLVGKFTPTAPNDSQWLPMAPNDSRQLPTTTNTRCCCLAPP